MSAASLRERWDGFQPQTKAAIVASLCAFALLIGSKASAGDFLGGYSDHFHHTHMSWTFFHLGFDAYRLPFVESSKLAPPFPYPCVTWGEYPNAYPVGMSVVFFLPTMIGRYVHLSDLEFGKVVIGYLTAIMIAALWHFGALMKRVTSPVWTMVAVAIWIFAIRAALMGFYDGAWLLLAALSVRALDRGEHVKSMLWFAASALVSYRAACFAPFGLLAFWGLLKAADVPLWKKASVIVATGIAALLVVWTFWLLLKHSPPNKHGVESALLPMKFRTWILLLGGLAVAGLFGRTTSWLVGASVAVSTLLCIMHAGHSWHGFVCYPPLLALAISERKPLWAQLVLGLWIVIFWRFAFFFEPFNWLEEVFLFVERAGNITQQK